MKLEKAIEMLKQDTENQGRIAIEDLIDAEKLGIEALKREQHRRKYDIHLPIELLPGETKD